MNPPRFLRTLPLLVLAAFSAHAGGVRDFPLPPIQPASHPIVIDGSLEDWKAVPPTRYQPLAVHPRLLQTEATKYLEEVKHSASWRMSYDTTALYVAVEWESAKKLGDAASLDLALKTDRTFHLCARPQQKGSSLTQSVTYRIGNETEATDSAAAGITSAIAAREGGYVQEFAIPWKVLTASGQLPTEGKIEWAAELGWSDLSPDFLRALPNLVLTTDLATSRNFLTASSKLYSERYVSNSGLWGDLAFTATPVPFSIERDSVGNTGITKLTAPQSSPAIDGDLGEWGDLPKLQIAADLIGPDTYSAKTGLRFDAKNLYFAAHITTALPIFNSKPAESHQGFLGGDALQVRISQGEKQADIVAWYDSEGKVNALSSSSASSGYKDKDLLAAGGTLVIKPDADGKGYVIEAAVPWEALLPGVLAPKIGDTGKACFQVWWAGVRPTFTILGGAVALKQRGALDFTYDMPVDGEISLGIFDKSGELKRWLTRSNFRPKGSNTEFWDGLDQYGNPLPAQDYVVKALVHQPLALDYRITLANPGTPPWITPDGKGDWLSDESNPQGAATDGSWVFLAAPCSEKGFGVIGVDETGQKQWGLRGPIQPRSSSVAVDGDFVYVLYSGPELTDGSRRYDRDKKNAIGRATILCLDKRTGNPAGFSKISPLVKVATWPYREEVSFLWDLRRDQNFTPATYGGQPRYFTHDIGESTNALGIAAAGGKLYVSLFYENRILILDAATGQQTGELSLPAPVGLHAPDARTLYAVSGTQVVKFDLAASQPDAVPVIKTDLLAPFSVTSDKSGRIYVSDWKSSFQVKVFSPEGKFLHAIGKEGGRPWLGKWQSDGMLVPRGIAVTDAGKLWVAEDDGTPRRVSIWDAQSGAFLKDYIGPTPYGGGGLVWWDPKDETQAFALGTRFKLDYAAKTYSPETVMFRRTSLDQPFMPHGATGHNMARPFTRDGKEYVVFSDFLTFVILQKKGDIYVPVAAVGGREASFDTMDGTDIAVWDSDIGKHSYYNFFPEFFRGKLNVNYSWSDLNDDGLVQADEMRWVESLRRSEKWSEGRQGSRTSRWGTGFGPDASVYFSTQCQDMRQIFRLDPQRWTESGVPIFDIAEAKPIVNTPDPKGGISGIYVNSENKVFVSYKYEFWRGAIVNDDAITCFDREGKRLWGIAMPVGKSEKELDFDVMAEAVVGEFNLPGIGNVLGSWLWHGSFKAFLFTSDGLYVGAPLDNTLVGPASTWGESFRYYYQAPDGTPHIINGASTGDHLLRIKGLENSTRFELPLSLTEAQVEQATALRSMPQVKEPPKPIVRVNWDGPAPAIDGNLADWNMDTGVVYRSAKGAQIKTALRRDEQRLYLAYEVEDDSPMVNQGANWQTLFITGDCADIMLATDPAADPNRSKAAPGDLRLLFSTFQGEPIAVLYRPSVPGTKEPVQLMAARLDEIKKLPSADISIQRSDKGYIIEASVPLADLGLDPQNVPSLRGDVGVVYSDQMGRERTERVYYYNQQTGMISDLSTEATLTPRMWGPVEFPLGKNLLHNGTFESPLVASASEGWILSQDKNGAEAEVLAEAPHSGRAALRLRQTLPVTYTPDALKNPDLRKFLDSANDGKGGGRVAVTQDVPIQPGKKYALRFHYRAEGLKREVKKGTGPRGGGYFSVWLYWHGSTDATNKHIWVCNLQHDSDEWQTLLNANSKHHTVSRPYTAPTGATTAKLTLSAITTYPGALPSIHVDDVEFVEVP